MFKATGGAMEFNLRGGRETFSRKAVITVILGVALVAFEIFNFDTTQFALSNLLGDVRFAGLMWATILAVAFCAIDFAGLVRIFTPQRGREEPRAVWFLTGAWFLGTIANSIMTWWAVSLTLLSHEFGNEVLSREALLRYVPIFVAMLVWLTRILFIGAFSVAGEGMVEIARNRADGAPVRMHRPEVPASVSAQAVPAGQQAKPVSPQQARNKPTAARASTSPANRMPISPERQQVTYEPVDDPFDSHPSEPKTNGANGPSRPASRIQQRPPMPGGRGRSPLPGNMQASSPNRERR